MGLQALCIKHFLVHELIGPLRHTEEEEDRYGYTLFADAETEISRGKTWTKSTVYKRPTK